MTHQEFFDWLKKQLGKKLTQTMVDGANELLTNMTPEKLKNILTKINGWTDNNIATATATTTHNSAVAKASTSNSSKMQLSIRGLNLIKGFEGFVSNPYQDSSGVWTIGYGNTYYLDGSRVKPTDSPLTESQASQLKMAIINKDFATAVNRLLAEEIRSGKITQNMYDALVSLGYNIGVGALAKSSVIRYLKEDNKSAAADSFLLWNKAGGQELAGLTNRRMVERQLFLS